MDSSQWVLECYMCFFESERNLCFLDPREGVSFLFVPRPRGYTSRFYTVGHMGVSQSLQVGGFRLFPFKTIQKGPPHAHFCSNLLTWGHMGQNLLPFGPTASTLI